MTTSARGRMGTIDVPGLAQRPWLIVNPRAGSKLGVSTNQAGPKPVQDALNAAGVDVDVRPTDHAGHATALAQAAVDAGCELVIAAGGDGTVAEAAHGLIGTDVALGIMPMGSIMNMARTLCVPRDLTQAAQVIAAGQCLTMDVGRVNGRYFLEAAGVGLAAGLFGYFDRVDRGRVGLRSVIPAAWRFMRSLGNPLLSIDIDGRHIDVRAPQVTVANGPFVGAAYVLAPEARVDDGLLDVVVFRRTGVLRVLAHMLLVAGGRRLQPPPETQVFRARSVTIGVRRRRPLPVHADADVIGATPTTFEVVPAALRVIVGQPGPDSTCAWRTD